MKEILGAMRRAIQDYDMILEGDVVAVGVSGGKDSLLLFESLWRLQHFYPQHFTLVPIYVDMGFDAYYAANNMPVPAPAEGAHTLAQMQAYFAAKGTELHIVPTQLGQLLFDVRGGKDACSLCSKMRRGALCNKAVELGCNKLALGHHADDVLDTMLLSFIYEGRLSTFDPICLMERTGVTVIRPMVYLYESTIAQCAAKLALPVQFNPCPSDHHTCREDMKELVLYIQQKIPIAKDRMVAAIENPERNHLWPPKNPKRRN